MPFNSLEYGAFLVVVVVAFWLAPGTWRRPLLLVASYLFYSFGNLQFLPLLFVVSAVSWWVGVSLPTTDDPGRRKALLGVGLATVGGVLVLFKVAATGSTLGLSGTSLLVPVGLSFYTFQAVSYMVDVYRREAEAVPSIIDVALYIAFFPHLLAGPLLRTRKLIPAIHALPDRPDPHRFTEGLELILVGIFKKVVLADPVFALISHDPSAIQETSGVQLVVWGSLTVTASFFDISGYIDVARGSAKLLGIDMQPNFAEPLTRSRNWTDFWRRWQITVMMWFRDYVFRPIRSLGGSRPSTAWENTSLFLTFVVVGAWHGLTVTWLVWSFLVGGILVIERELQARRAKARRAARLEARQAAREAGMSRAEVREAERAANTQVSDGPFRRARQLAYVWALLLLTLPWAGLPDPRPAFAGYPHALLNPVGPVALDDILFLAASLVALVVLDRRERIRQRFEGHVDPPTVLRAVGFGAMAVAILVFSGSSSETYLYFRF